MIYLFAGTAVIWLGILGYMVSLSSRQKKLEKQLDKH